MKHYAYLYKDPKTNLWRYVGKGTGKRYLSHFWARCQTQLGRMLKKRVREGFNPQAILIPADSDDEAQEIEMLLISLLGREDLGKGTLFNKTNGGGGCIGRIPPKSEIDKRVASFKAKSKEEWDDITSRATRGKQKYYNDPVWIKQHAERARGQLSKRCTVDGVNVYNSRKELIAALGQSKTSGSRSPNFRYVK